MRDKRQYNDLIAFMRKHKATSGGTLPSGTENQTLRRGASAWEATSGLKSYTDGAEITVDNVTGADARISNVIWYNEGDTIPDASLHVNRTLAIEITGGWQEILPAGDADKAWWASACSSDGAIIFVAVNGGRLYRSEDSGDTWSEIQPAGDTDKNWRVVSCSNDGQFVLAGGNSQRLYRSEDGGDSWDEVQPAGNVNRNWKGVAVSGDGSSAIASCWGIVGTGRVYTSANSGDSWTERQPAGDTDRSWWSACADYDGSFFMVGDYDGRLWRSENSGVGWDEPRPGGDINLEYKDIACSSDGAVVLVGYSNYLGLSTDSGDTWGNIDADGEGGLGIFGGVGCSSDGQTLFAFNTGTFYHGREAYRSVDGGTTWEDWMPTASGDWLTLSLSNDGAIYIISTGVRLYLYKEPETLSKISIDINDIWYDLDVDLSTIPSGVLPMANGGTAKALTASNGGIVYTDADSMEILAGTATAGQIPRSGASSAPSWSTATYPATIGVSQLLYGSAANVIGGLATGNSSILVTDGSGVPSLSTTLPAHTVTTQVAVPKVIASTSAGLSLFEDGGTGIFVQDSTGFVGIGTTSPSFLVHIIKSQNAATYLVLDNATQNTAAQAILVAREQSGQGLYMGYNCTNYSPAAGSEAYVAKGGAIWVPTNSTGGLSIIATAASGSIRFFTDGAGTANERGRFNSTGLSMYAGMHVTTDTVMAKSASGLELFEDGGTGIFVQDSTGFVGIGTTSPNSLLHLAQTYTDFGTQRALRIISPSVVTINGTNYLLAFDMEVTDVVIPTGVTDSGYRLAIRGQSYISNVNYRGTLTAQYGVWGRAGINTCGAGGVVTNAYAGYFQILNADADGTITNAYGVYISNSGVTGTITNRYGVYQVGSTAINYFEGSLAVDGTSLFSGHTYIRSDSVKAYFGAGDDMTIWYDGTNGNIKTSDVAASDLVIACGTDKTLVLNETVWDDVQFSVATGKVPAVNYPNWEAFTTNTSEFAFDVNEYIDLQGNEIPHSWKQGTNGSVHLHFAPKTLQNSGSSQYAKFTVYISYADATEVFTETSFDMETEIVNGTVALTHYLCTSATAFTLTNNLIGTQLKARVKRIAATGGTEYSDDVFITQVGVHIENDTLGSRQIGTK